MLLLLDFDETITLEDSLSRIAPAPGKQLHGPSFPHYTKAYLDDLDAHSASSPPPSTLSEQLAQLASLDVVELASQKRIEEGGLFRDLTAVSILERAEELPLRPGWRKMVEWLWDNRSIVETHVISVGWSARFIRSRLSGNGSGLPPNIPRSISANEVEIDPVTKLCTGRLTKSSAPAESGLSGIRTAQDKQREMRRLVEDWQRRGGDGVVVYIGDSTTDLGCLVDAGLGLVMGGKTSMKETCERIGVKIVDRGVHHEDGDLVGVGDWHEVLEALETLE